MTQLNECRTLKELMIHLKDESVCRKYMEEKRWGDNPVCPHCGKNKPYRMKDGKTFRCRSKTCKKDFTVTVGTIFENSKVPLSTWIAASYVLSAHKKGISSCQLARDLGITQKTAWFVLHRIRESLRSKDSIFLKNLVEIDEVYIGGRVKNMSNKKRAAIKESGSI